MKPVAAIVNSTVKPFHFPEPVKTVASPIIAINGGTVGYSPGKPVLKQLTLRIDEDDRIALFPPEPDGVETTEARWFEPAAALAAQEAGELALAFPTISQLQSLLPYRTSDEALAAYRDRAVEPILPVVLGDRENHRVVMPGDPDYPA